MKIKKIILCTLLCCFCAFAVVGFAGCGETTIANLKSSFEKLEATYETYSDVFEEGECEGLQTKYLISYGTVVDGYVSTSKQYGELKSLYNATLAIASDYIDENKEFVLRLTDKELSKASKAALKTLNSCVSAYTKTISAFVRERESFIEHFRNFAGQSSSSDEASLLRFKRAYGEMVKKNVELSVAMAKMVETTKIFDLLKVTQTTEADTETVKEYIRAKMLPIFSEFKITEIANNMNWEAQKEGDCKTRINALISKMDSLFGEYKENLVAKTAEKLLSNEDMNFLFDMADEFFSETEEFLQALSDLNLSKLAINYNNNLQNYSKTNTFAEVYLEKLEQFADVTAQNFLQNIESVLF